MVNDNIFRELLNARLKVVKCTPCLYNLTNRRLFPMDALFIDSLFLANVSDFHSNLLPTESQLKISQSRSQVFLIPMNCMLTPPEQTYDTYENLRASINAFTCTHGYNVIVARYTGGCKYLLMCDRGGTPRRVLEEKRKRKGVTKKCDCKFQLFARFKKG